MKPEKHGESAPAATEPKPAEIVERKPILADRLPAPLGRMGDVQLRELVTSAPDKAVELIRALIAKNTNELPDTTFVRRDGAFIKAVRVNVPLSESAGHLLRLRKKDGKEWVSFFDLTVNGLRRLNEVAGLQLIRPETIAVEGKTQMNPYIQVGEKSKRPEVVYARALCIGYGPTGGLIGTDVMVRLDMGIYFVENVQSKMSWDTRAGEPPLAIYGVIDQKPTDEKNQPIPGAWKFEAVHGDMGLWVNMASPKFGKVMEDHVQKLKFVERLAQSFAERNAFKAHPAIPKGLRSDVKTGTASATVIGWHTDFDRDAIDRLRQLAQDDRLHDFVDKSGSKIEVSRHETNVGADDIAALDQEALVESGATIADEDDADPAAKKAAADAEAAANVDRDKLMATAIAEHSKFIGSAGRVRARKLLEELEISVIEEASNEQLQKLVESVAKETKGS